MRGEMRIPQEIADRLVDPAAHGDGSLHEAFSWLRVNNPLGYAEPESTDPFWVVTKYNDLKTISMDADLFHSGDRSITLINREEERRMREIFGMASPVRTIIQMDAPDHAKYRNITAAAFRPDNVIKLQDSIREIARASIDEMANHGGECDFAEDVAFMYPLRVVMSVLGVPAKDERLMLRMTQEFFNAADADQARGEVVHGHARAEQIAQVAREFAEYFAAHLAARRATPQDDVMSVIANAVIDGKQIPDLEAFSYCQVAATAGHDTTSAATAGGVWGLATNPEEFAKVKADRSLITALVDEAIRWTSPSKMTMRAAARDAELLGRQFREGDWVGLAWASGNRDETAFPEPFAFKADRRPNRLLAFGWGPHNCIGQHLARMEMRILFEEFFDRVESLELAGEPAGVSSLSVSGPKRVPIRYKLR